VPSSKDDEIEPLAVVIVVIVVAAALIWEYVIPAIEAWWAAYGRWVEVGFVGLVVLVVVIYWQERKNKAIRDREMQEQVARAAEESRRVEAQQAEEKMRLEEETRRFEEEQRLKGLVKFISEEGGISWVTPSQAETMRREEEERSLPNRVVQAIQEFQPSRRYHNEFPYQTELQGWLKSRFPTSKIEIQTGASRPDIVIEDIAIEVKGPTDNNALNTLTTKCLKYSQYYSKVILVLFEPVFSESNFREIEAGIQRLFPHVYVVRKD
jgi:hypothetical protein